MCLCSCYAHAHAMLMLMVILMLILATMLLLITCSYSSWAGHHPVIAQSSSSHRPVIIQSLPSHRPCHRPCELFPHRGWLRQSRAKRSWEHIGTERDWCGTCGGPAHHIGVYFSQRGCHNLLWPRLGLGSGSNMVPQLGSASRGPSAGMQDRYGEVQGCKIGIEKCSMRA